jgi:hypothetical protein
MWRRVAAGLLIVVLTSACLLGGAHAQSGGFPCDNFVKNADGSWSAIHSVHVPIGGQYLNIADGSLFPPNMSIMGTNIASTLNQECPAVAAAAPLPGAPPQVDLSNLANTNGIIDTANLTCAQLASVYQEDADFLGAWYFGWHSAYTKKQVINVAQIKQDIHNVIVFCKANRDKLVAQAVESVLKVER